MKMEEWKTFYTHQNFPTISFNCELRIKDDMVVSGLNFFFGAFQYLMQKDEPIWSDLFKEYEGKKISNGTTIKFKLPFALLSKEKELL